MPKRSAADESRDLIAEFTARGLRIAVAESLTGGLLVAELIRVPGASVVVNGGIVAYHSDLKASLLGVDPALLARFGAVHPDVAIALARNVRERLAVEGRAADVGMATTGVAGPDEQDGHEPGTVFLGLSMGDRTVSRRLALSGSRDEIRAETVRRALCWLGEALDTGLVESEE